jgi:hypothetical protein
MTLPQRCQFWFKLGETYYLAESDSDRHARVLRRTLATATAAPAPITAATLPRAMKGNAVWSQGPATPTMLTWQLNPWSLAIAKTNSDGTFDGSITFVGPGCAARELPIANGVIQGGEVRFSVQMGARCPERFRLRGGSEHLLEGEAEFDAGARPARVWLDPS